MAQFEIAGEAEVDGGWRFDVRVLGDDGAVSEHAVTLSWADYNLWSASGADRPADVAGAVLSFLLARTEPAPLAASFDASLARRLHAEADAAIPGLIRPAPP